MNSQVSGQMASTRYKVLRSLFILGCILSIGMTFIPMARVKFTWYFNGEEKLLSDFQGVQLAFLTTGQFGIALLFVLFFAGSIAVLVMAIVYQRRWVFMIGASLAAIGLLIDLFTPSNPNVKYLPIPQLIQYIANLSILSGFFAKPPIVKS